MRGLAREVAGQRHHRRRAEQAVAHARGRKARVGRGQRQIAGGDQLAAGGGRDAVDQRDHRLRQAGEREHDRRALLEQRPDLGRVGALAAQLLEVVTGAEGAPLAGDHDHPDVRIVPDLVELALQRAPAARARGRCRHPAGSARGRPRPRHRCASRTGSGAAFSSAASGRSRSATSTMPCPPALGQHHATLYAPWSAHANPRAGDGRHLATAPRRLRAPGRGRRPARAGRRRPDGGATPRPPD